MLGLPQLRQVYNDGKFLAVADEEGFISIVDTAAPLPRTTADDEDPKPRAQWLAHKNAVFDIAWAKVCTAQVILLAGIPQTISGRQAVLYVLLVKHAF